MDKWTEGQLKGNQRGLPSLQLGETRCSECKRPISALGVEKGAERLCTFCMYPEVEG